MEPLQRLIQEETEKSQKFYRWIEAHMPPSFFQEVSIDNIILITHALMSFDLQDFFTHIHLKDRAFVLCLDSPEADLRILENFRNASIKNYRGFVSNEPPPFPGVKSPLRIASLLFTDISEEEARKVSREVLEEIKTRNPEVTDAELSKFLKEANPRFLRSLTKERLTIALDMYFRAKTRDMCQYEVLLNKKRTKKEMPSMRVVLAWKQVPKSNFLYRLAKVVYRHHLVMTRAYATYIDPYSKDSILIMSIGIDGQQNKPAWEVTDIEDFLRELVTFKYFDGDEKIEKVFVDSELVSGNLGNLIKTFVDFAHQTLVHGDYNVFSRRHVEEGLCRHPELTVQITEAFEAKFHPEKHDSAKYKKIRDDFLKLVDKLDTGNELNDIRRKNVLYTAMNFVEFTLKTNFYRKNKTAFSFRLDPKYLDHVPYEKTEKFPELPYAIFFMKGEHFIGFHIRFKDLARGGLRTVLPERSEQMYIERNNVFSEAYNLAYTQQKKNKDIPEGGAKGIIFLEPYEYKTPEEEIYKKEMEAAEVSEDKIAEKIKEFHKEQKLEYLYRAQRHYIEAFMTLINCEADGKLKAKNVIDYYKKPEYIYLGPDENMHNSMIVWISNYSKSVGYRSGGSFMSSKPGAGINHKEYGVTSFGVNVYMEEVLKFLGIDPKKDPFTIKISGGPDGDVAGNQILNLYKYYPKTAKLLALTDVSGTILDPEGLDLSILASFFHEGKPIRFYPAEKLHDGGFLLDLGTKREETAYAQQTLCLRKENGRVVEDWLSGNDMNHLLRHNLHQTITDIFIPGGGRPRTLNDSNYKDYLDETGKPTSKAIVEGANLYLTPGARRALEKLGVLIIKDSSANKGGVICSSFEILCGLTLTDEEFIQNKPTLTKEILQIIGSRARDEANLLLKTYQESHGFLTEISELVSEHINTYMYQILDHLEKQQLSNDPNDMFIRCLLNYCPPFLRNNYQDRILKEVPDIHKKAIIACYIASRLVYNRGLSWGPTIIDSLPIIVQESYIINP